ADGGGSAAPLSPAVRAGTADRGVRARYPRHVAVIVQKYGGTSVGTVDRIGAVAERVVEARRQGYDVVVVVSAMGQSTDELLAMAHRLSPLPNPRELDMLLTAGERIAIDRKSTRLNSSHVASSYAVFCLKKKYVCISCVRQRSVRSREAD